MTTKVPPACPPRISTPAFVHAMSPPDAPPASTSPFGNTRTQNRASSALAIAMPWGFHAPSRRVHRTRQPSPPTLHSVSGSPDDRSYTAPRCPSRTALHCHTPVSLLSMRSTMVRKYRGWGRHHGSPNHSMGVSPREESQRFTAPKWPQPRKPRWALSGLGWGASSRR